MLRVLNHLFILISFVEILAMMFPPKAFEVDKATPVFNMLSEVTEDRMSRESKDLFSILKKPKDEEVLFFLISHIKVKIVKLG